MLGGYVDFGIRTDHQSLDVNDLNSIRSICNTHKPRVILHLAAMTNLIECEKDQDKTYSINAIGTYNVALVAREIGAKLVYVSTTVVFDGKKKEAYDEKDMPSPQSCYAHSKYLGELAVQGVLNDYIIARTCCVFGGGPKKDHKFVANILKQIQNSTIEVIGGKRGSPTYGKDLVQALVQLIEKDERGIFHVSNSGTPTRVDIAQEIVKITNARAHVFETDGKSFETTYPGASARGNESIVSNKLMLRSWQDALAEYIHTEWSDVVTAQDI